jgi:hypothetical protein
MTILTWRWRRKSKKRTSAISDLVSTPSVEQLDSLVNGGKATRNNTEDKDIQQMARSIAVPVWFLENCVTTAIELKTRAITLVVWEPGSNKESATSTSSSRQFEVEPAIYAALHAARRKPRKQQDPSDSKPVQFRKSHISLHIPN